MTRTDRASQLVRADRLRTFAALVDQDALVEWLPPDGMSGHFEHYDAVPGGGYRLVLTYEHSHDGPGKATEDADVVVAHFVEIEPGVRLVQAVEFESDDPAFAGTMTMTWSLRDEAGATRVELQAADVPVGISAADHDAGMSSSLRQLAAYVERTSGRSSSPQGSGAQG